METFGEKKSRYTQGLVPGIRVAVHLEDVFEQHVVSPILYSDDMRTTTYFGLH